MRILELGRETARTWWLVAALLIAACVSAKESPQAGGESHFLRRCDDQCGAGLDCIQGVCTRGCVVGKQSCGDLSMDAVCTAESVEPGEVAVCDVACRGTSDCAGISASHRCEAGFCRALVVSAARSDAGAGSNAGDGGFPTREVFVCPEGVATDPVEVTRSLILGNELRLYLAAGTGCGTTSFAVCFGPEFRESYPVQTSLRVINAQPDLPCQQQANHVLDFDLTPLAQHYERSYRSKAGLVQTNYGLYAFGTLSCEDRTLAAEAQLATFEEKASRPCTSADDCQGASFDTRCTRGCGTVIAKEQAAEFSSWLAVMDREVCGDYDGAGCLPLPTYDCGELEPICVQGRCQHRSR